MFAGLENLHDVRVPQLRDRRDLGPEPFTHPGVGPAVGGNRLERDGPAERQLPGRVHDTHPAPSEHRHDIVARQRGSIFDQPWPTDRTQNFVKGVEKLRGSRRFGGRFPEQMGPRLRPRWCCKRFQDASAFDAFADVSFAELTVPLNRGVVQQGDEFISG